MVQVFGVTMFTVVALVLDKPSKGTKKGNDFNSLACPGEVAASANYITEECVTND